MLNKCRGIEQSLKSFVKSSELELRQAGISSIDPKLVGTVNYNRSLKRDEQNEIYSEKLQYESKPITVERPEKMNVIKKFVEMQALQHHANNQHHSVAKNHHVTAPHHGSKKHHAKSTDSGKHKAGKKLKTCKQWKNGKWYNWEWWGRLLKKCKDSFEFDVDSWFTRAQVSLYNYFENGNLPSENALRNSLPDLYDGKALNAGVELLNNLEKTRLSLNNMSPEDKIVFKKLEEAAASWALTGKPEQVKIMLEEN